MFQIFHSLVIKRDAAYTAGVIDAEGSAIMYKSQNKYYNTSISISNTNLEFLKDIQQMILPWQATITGPYYKGKGHNDAYRLSITHKNQNIVDFIKEIEPYVMLKATQLQLVKEFEDGKCSDPELTYQILKKLNKRGL